MKTPTYCYKIRKITVNNKTGDAYGITIPRNIAKQFADTYMYISSFRDGMVFESGCAPFKKKKK